jgi:hypothetical protein
MREPFVVSNAAWLRCIGSPALKCALIGIGLGCCELFAQIGVSAPADPGATVPEPATWILMTAALTAGLGYRKYRRNN